MSTPSKGAARHVHAADPVQRSLLDLGDVAPPAARSRTEAPAVVVGRPIVFVKYYDKASTVLCADQVSDALARRGLVSRSLHAGELATARDSILVFVKTSRLHHLLLARARRNLLVLDVQDTLVFKRRLKSARFFDGILFRNGRQLADFGRRETLCGVIPQHWDPRYAPHRVPAGRFKAAYLGDRRSLALFGEIDGVAFIEGEFFHLAPQFNCHLSIREPGRDFLYKPNLKVATAAACGAVLVTTRDVASVEMLGEDYPYYCEPDRASVEATLARARATCGGADWQRALSRLAAVRELTALDRVLSDYLGFFAELAAREKERRERRSGSGARRAAGAPSAGG